MSPQKEKTYGQDCTILGNDVIRIALLPEIGGKMVELTFKRSGMQLLHTLDDEIMKVPRFGNTFDERFAFGFDECFPTVAPCTYSFDNREVKLANHGEAWSRPWKYSRTGDSIQLVIDGVYLDYTLGKNIHLSDSSVIIDYCLTNTGSVDFDYIWSAHPLLSIDPGDELLLNDEITEVLLNWSSDASLGKAGDYLSWPDLFGEVENQNFNTVASESLRFAAKLFTDKLKTGKAGIFKKETGESLIFSFDVDEIPYLGIWICYGGWPVDSVEKEYTLALEPCSGRPDDLSTAIDRSESSKIGPGATKKWSMNIKLNPGKEKLN